MIEEVYEKNEAEEEDVELTEEVKQELKRRIKAHEENPQSAIPWEEVEARIRTRSKI